MVSRIKFDGEVPSESALTSYYTTNLREGDIKNMFDSSIEDGNYIAWNKPIPVGTQLFTIEAESPVSEIEIVNWRPTYAPGWRILEDGIEVFKATSNEGDAETPNPATYTYTLERDSPPPSPPPAEATTDELEITFDDEGNVASAFLHEPPHPPPLPTPPPPSPPSPPPEYFILIIFLSNLS